MRENSIKEIFLTLQRFLTIRKQKITTYKLGDLRSPGYYNMENINITMEI